MEPKIYPLLGRGKTQAVILHHLTTKLPARPHNRPRGIYGGEKSDITKGFLRVLLVSSASIIQPNAP